MNEIGIPKQYKLKFIHTGKNLDDKNTVADYALKSGITLYTLLK